ncbi:DUF6456 domain-containing protein [Rhizobium sp. YIM 134829]|uniref:DUF6456 domain-containing protein n=1 Tax=Rhizobium sp. YIM 134829 TaxID=3390453 RepID=UPI00397DF6E2
MREGGAGTTLAALLRHLAAGPARSQRSETGAGIRLERADGTARMIASSLLTEAVSRGLVIEEGEEVALTSPGRAALRRHLAAKGLSHPLARGEGGGAEGSAGQLGGGVRGSALKGSSRVPAASPSSDPDDPGGFAAQHRAMAERPLVEGGEVRMVRVNLGESPLAGLARLKEKSGAPFLSEAALSAGERLHRDFTRGQMQPRLIMAYATRLETPTAGAQAQALSDSALSARDRVTAAVLALGPELSSVALDICCFEKGLETVERERQWPARSAKLLLRAALMALARHYEPAPRARRSTHAWAAEGGRPIGPRG